MASGENTRKLRAHQEELKSYEQQISADDTQDSAPSTSGYLTDEHILELSKRITDSEELMDLGIRVLKLPESKLRAELYNQRNWIQGATLAALSTWLKHQNTRQEAFRNLCEALTKAEMNHLASELRTWVGGAVQSSGISHNYFHDLQKKLKRSLERTWKHALTLDWISPDKAKSLPLLDFYTGLRWTKLTKALKKYKVELTSIYDILTIVGPDDELRPVNLFVEAPPGMGKTSSLALLALKWVKGKDSSEKIPFDLVFLVRLRYTTKGLSLPEIIKIQHDGIEEIPVEFLENILKGKTEYRVLLMLDGYDEYSPGTNKDVDDAIKMTVGNCFLILTCRTGDYLNKRTRDQMDGEIIIEGFSEERILQCSISYIGSREKSKEMLKQAEQAGIHTLLHIPIILVMTIVVFLEEESLPKSKTGIYRTIYKMMIDRNTLKKFGLKSDDIPKMHHLLHTLGEFSWKALHQKLQPLFLKKKDLEGADLDLLHLGLLHEVGMDTVTLKERPAVMSFEHKTLQEFSSSIHVTGRLERAEGEDQKDFLKELFPSWIDIKRYEEVVAFTCGQMKNPRPLVDYIYQVWVERELKWMRSSHWFEEGRKQLRDEGTDVEDPSLFQSLFVESTVPLPGQPFQNIYHNYYNHKQDDDKKRVRNTSPVYIPSRLYEFRNIKGNVPCDLERVKQWEVRDVPTCSIVIVQPDPQVTSALLSTTHRITQVQAVTDLWMQKVKCEDLSSAEAPIISRKARSVTLAECDLPVDFLRSVLHQLAGCRSLQILRIPIVNLKEVQEDLDKLLESLVDHHKTGASQVFPESEKETDTSHHQMELMLVLVKTNVTERFKEKWSQRCWGIPSISYICD